jgi:phosphate uptake regulator
VAIAMHLFVASQAADRIADHAAIIGARLRYLLTGEASHLVAEVR